MSESLPDISSPEWAWSALRRDALQLVAWGYAISEKLIRERTLEEEITGLIRKGIRTKLNEDLPPRFKFYSPHSEDPEDASDEYGKNRPRIDINIESSGCTPRKHYRIEAKRCARGKFNSKYTIDWYADGVRSYVRLRYASDSPEAAVLGLMQSDNAPYWKWKLTDKLASDQSLAVLSPITDVDVSKDLPCTCVSAHVRADGSQILLCHAFLNCLKLDD
jgi:hypothetical protein